MAAISIIIPVYNVHDRLLVCLDSICAQSMRDFECILVDDGSTDGSSQLLEEYAKKDSRFIVIHQENAGVGTARNRGLQHAHGIFLTFIDSDDQVEPSYLENLLRMIGQQDLLITGFTMCKPDSCERIGSVSGELSVEKIAVAMKEGLLNSCWAKLYRRDTFEELRFTENISWGEDTAYLMSCLCRTNRVVFDCSHDYLYSYSMSGLANRFDKRKPDYLAVYYTHLIRFLIQWAHKGDPLYTETAIKISQEMFRTIDVLIDMRLTVAEERQYLHMLFINQEVNRLFSFGAKVDKNPTVLKLLAKFPNVIIWNGYIRLRRYVQRGKNEKTDYLQ